MHQGLEEFSRRQEEENQPYQRHGQIEKAQVRVSKRKTAYDMAGDALKKPLDKRNTQRKDAIWNVIIKSDKSYEKILRLISDEEIKEEWCYHKSPLLYNLHKRGLFRRKNLGS